MIGIDDLIHIPYTPDLTESGVTYACRSLPHVFVRRGSSSSDHLRGTAAGVAVELAFRRYLTEQNIPFDVKGASPFTDPDRYDVSLGGRRCDLRTFLISHRAQISALRADSALALKAPALVPLDQYSAAGHSENDLYLFAFLIGLIAASQDDLKKAAIASQPAYFVHAMPAAWVRPQSWIPLGQLALKSEADDVLTLEIGGQDLRREFITTSVVLYPHTRSVVDADFYSLAYLHAKSKPGGRLGVFSPSRKETYLIKSTDWSNIWIYGMDICLAGWISRPEFRRHASLIPEGSRVFQLDRTHTKNLAVSISELRPLAELFEHVHDWQGQK